MTFKIIQVGMYVCIYTRNTFCFLNEQPFITNSIISKNSHTTTCIHSCMEETLENVFIFRQTFEFILCRRRRALYINQNVIAMALDNLHLVQNCSNRKSRKDSYILNSSLIQTHQYPSETFATNSYRHNFNTRTHTYNRSLFF